MRSTRAKSAEINGFARVAAIGTQLAVARGMPTRSLHSVYWPVLALLCACADEAGVADPAGSADDRAARAAQGTSDDAQTTDDAGSAPDGSAASALPASPEHFEIQIARSECFGSCPVYTARIDEAGEVRFRGEQCVTRVGVATRELPAAEARALYDALRASPFATLNPRYVNEDDGCKAYSTDGPGTTWRVTVDGVAREVLRYSGCEGLPDLEALDALEADVKSTLQLEDWVGPVRYGCEQAFDYGPFGLRIGLRYDGVSLGTLEPAADHRFVLKGCDGAELVRGVATSDRLDAQVSRWVLMAEDMSTLQLPGALGEVGSLVIRMGDAAQQPGADEGRILGVDAQRADSDETLGLEFSATPGCGT
jgi:Domain of unknown function (DUF6438)